MPAIEPQEDEDTAKQEGNDREASHPFPGKARRKAAAVLLLLTVGIEDVEGARSDNLTVVDDTAFGKHDAAGVADLLAQTLVLEVHGGGVADEVAAQEPLQRQRFVFLGKKRVAAQQLVGLHFAKECLLGHGGNLVTIDQDDICRMNLGQPALFLASDDALAIDLLKRLLQMGAGLDR